MSNNQMISVPRDELEAACQRFAKAQIFDFSRRMRAFLTQPAEPHQGESVTLPARKHPVRSDYSQDILAEGWNACLDEIAKLGPLYTRPAQGEPVAQVISKHGDPEAFGEREIEVLVDLSKIGYGTKLYTHADPAEVERLRAVIEQQKNLIESLRHDLVESHSIDASAEPCATKCKHPVKCARFDNGEIVDHICQDCLQVFKPSAPVEIDERAAFESTYHLHFLGRDKISGAYIGSETRALWDGWQARAALERKP